MADTDSSPTDSAPTDTGRGQWALLVDPGWQPEDEDAEVPESAIVGAWLVEADGTTRTFRANHLFRPSSPEVPTDPVDAELKLVLRGESDTASLLATLRPAELWIAVDEQGAAIVTPAPDDVPSVLVATAPVQAQQLEVPGWQEIGAAELAAELPADGVDVLLNPGGTASVRIGAQEFRDAVADQDTAGQPVPPTSAMPEEAPAPAVRAAGPDPATADRPDQPSGGPAAEHATATARRATAAAPPAATGEPAPATAADFAADLAAWQPITDPDAGQPPYLAEELDGFDDPLPPPPSFPGRT